MVLKICTLMYGTLSRLVRELQKHGDRAKTEADVTNTHKIDTPTYVTGSAQLQNYKTVLTEINPWNWKSMEYESISIQRPPDVLNSAAFWNVPRLHRFVLPVTATCRWRWVCSIGGIMLTGGNPSARRKTCPSAILSTTNLTDWPGIDPGSRR